MKSIIVTKGELRKIKQLQKHLSEPLEDRETLEAIHMVPDGNGLCYASDGVSLLVQKVSSFSDLQGQVSIEGVSRIRQGRAVIDVSEDYRDQALDIKVANLVAPCDVEPTVIFVDPKKLAHLLLAFEGMVALEIYGTDKPIQVFSENQEGSVDQGGALFGMLMPMHSTSKKYYSPVELHTKLKEQ